MDQMFRMLSIALCSISCTSAHIDQTTCSYPTTPACDKYVYISDTVARTRDEADTLCFSHKYGGLATISSEDDLECALSTIGDGNARPWIGLMSYMEPESGDWHQMDGTPCPLTNGNCVGNGLWEHSKPHRCAVGSECVRVSECKLDNDIQCDNTLNGVLCNNRCVSDEYSGYYITPGWHGHLHDWNEAEAECVSRYSTHLATILTQDDLYMAQHVFNDTFSSDVTGMFIGMNDKKTEDDWVWADGTCCSLDDGFCSQFWVNQPDNIDDYLGHSNSDCAFLWPGFNDQIVIELHCETEGIGYLCNHPNPPAQEST